jgi:hypothetical protein
MRAAYVVLVASGEELRVAADGPRLQVFALPVSARLFAHALEHEHGVPALVLRRTAREIADLLQLNCAEPEDLDVVEAATTDARDCAAWIEELAARCARGNS